MVYGLEIEEYDPQSQHDVDGWIAPHMVCRNTNTTFEDGAVIAEVIHLGRNFGDCNETARGSKTRSWAGSSKNPHATAKFLSGNVEFETR